MNLCLCVTSAISVEWLNTPVIFAWPLTSLNWSFKKSTQQEQHGNIQTFLLKSGTKGAHLPSPLLVSGTEGPTNAVRGGERAMTGRQIMYYPEKTWLGRTLKNLALSKLYCLVIMLENNKFSKALNTGTDKHQTPESKPNRCLSWHSQHKWWN